MDMHVDQAWGDNQSFCIDRFRLLILDRGLVRDSFIDNRKIDNLIALVGRIDHAAVANNDRAHAAIPPQR